MVQLVGVRVFKTVLILRSTHAAFDRQILHRLHVQRDALEFCEFRLQTSNDVAGGDMTDCQWLQVDLYSTAIGSRVNTVDSDERRETLNCWIAEDDRCQCLLAFGHRSKRYGLFCIRNSEYDA